MTKYFKRPVSILLAVMMIMSLFTALPMTASAEVSAVTDATGLQAAFNSGGKITLGADIEVSTPLDVNADSELDLNGYTITGTSNLDMVIGVISNKSLTVLDSSKAQTGKIEKPSKQNERIFFVGAGAKLDIYGGSFIGTSDTTMTAVIYAQGENTIVNIYDGYFKCNSINPRMTTVVSRSKAVCNIYGGIFKSEIYNFATSGGTINVYGGNFTSNNDLFHPNYKTGGNVYGGVFNNDVSENISLPEGYTCSYPYDSSLTLVHKGNMIGSGSFWAVVDEEPDNGDDSDYTLYLFGTITNLDGFANTIPWRVHKENIKKVIAMSGTTSKIQSLNVLFFGHSKVTDIDLSGLDTSGVTSMANMFLNCESLENLTLGKFFVTSDVTVTANMFANCKN